MINVTVLLLVVLCLHVYIDRETYYKDFITEAQAFINFIQNINIMFYVLLIFETKNLIKSIIY